MAVNLTFKESVFLPCYRPYIYDYSYRYNIYYGGRGSGKTKWVIQKLVIKGLKEKRMILLMRKETNKLRDSVWKELLDVINEWNLKEFFSVNKTEFRVTCKLNGTEFKCLGLDESEKIKGFTAISDVFMDEVTAFTADDFELIDGTLRSKIYNLPLQIYIGFNPISKANWVYHYFGFDTGITPPDTFIMHTTYLDNPYLDESFHKRMDALKTRNFNRWKVEALGEFVTLDKLVFTNWKVEEFNHIDLPGTLLVGMDFGFVNDVSTIVASILNEDTKTIHIFKTWGDTGKTNDQLAAIIKNMGFAKSTIIADCAEQKSIEEIKRLGVTRIKASAKGKDSIIHGLQKLWQYDIIVHPSCEGIITEFENYSWKKDKSTGLYINQPVDAFNHYIDALRYSLQVIGNEARLKSISKSTLNL